LEKTIKNENSQAIFIFQLSFFSVLLVARKKATLANKKKE
jgi:hypothetical protein